MAKHLRSLAALVVVSFGLHILIVQSTSTRADDKAPSADAQTKEEKPLQAAATRLLGGQNRYLTHLSTDKNIYRPGEILRARGVVLHQETRKPRSSNSVGSMVEILGPKGDRVASGWAQQKEGVLGFRWDIAKSLPGGQYKLRVSSPHEGQPTAEREFEIRSYRAPRLKTQIKFLRDGYGPGDEAVATLHVERAEGGPPVGAKVTVIARVDNREVFRGQTVVGKKGECLARFELPKKVRRGEGTLALVIQDGGVVETASKTIPILLQTVDLAVYPEGGDLLLGHPNRVYFEAFTPSRKPADLVGIVVDDRGRKVGNFRSEHDGRGRFLLTPLAGRQYELRITKPSGIKTRVPLPAAKPAGVVLRSKADTFSADQPIRFAVAHSDADRRLRVTLSKRERILSTLRLATGKSGEVKFALKADDPSGVLVATVWDSQGRPLAERLVFRHPRKSIRIMISADADRYVPGGKARLSLQTTDSTGEPISALVGLTVTDDSVRQLTDRRDQPPRLPVMALLENDVRRLADAHVYLDSENPRSPLAVDLLLGTQGWRRFAFVTPNQFAQKFGDPARRVLALVAPRPQLFGGFGGGGRRVRRALLNENKKIQANLSVVKKGAARELAKALNQPGAAKPLAAAEKAGAKVHDGANGERDLEANDKQDGLRFARGGRARGRFGGGLGGFGQSAANDMRFERVYAHQVRPNRKPNQRVDFTETLFWHAGIRTDQNGKAQIEFGLNDAVTSFAVMADGFSADGSLGSNTITIDSVEPFYLEPKLPLEVTAGDRIRVPVVTVNSTDKLINAAAFEIQSDAALKVVKQPGKLDLPAGQRSRSMVELLVGSHQGPADVVLSAKAGSFEDKVTRQIVVQPAGFPIQRGSGGLIGPGDQVTADVTIPADVVKKSVQTRLLVYPTPLASMTESLKGLLRQPNGCFEQTSSTVYPLVMAQQYFMSHQGVDPTLIEKSSQILETGYQRLLGFETKGRGFEWFGRDPGHDALTAYGLMEFTDMAQVRHVDAAMLKRTAEWLLGQRDGKGGYVRKTRTYHTWLAEPEIANSYNTWALLKAGIQADLSREVKWIREAADKSSNTYVVALAANVLALSGEKDAANRLLDRLAGFQESNGSLSGATRSVVGSGGVALQIETTALAVTAWLTNPSYASQVEKSIKFIAESCKSGRFGSTQSTVLALQAIVAYDKSRAHPKADGTLQLLVDGQPVGNPLSFDKDTQGSIELPSFVDQLAPGRHQVQLRMKGGSPMPYSLAVDFHRLQPESSENCKLHLEVALQDKKMVEGGATEAKIVVTNRSNQDIPTPIAVVGIPGGLEVRHDQLKELVKKQRIAAYEVKGREVILYWRMMKAEQRVDLPISLIAAVPGSYTGPASRAYLYYTDEFKKWVGGLKVEIAAKK